MLRCPLCGISPIFPTLRTTRTLRDWFTPLDGCPRCGYPYDREPGYFLLAIWAVNYGFASLFGLGIYIAILLFAPGISTPRLLIVVLVPVVLFNLFFARHAKALFIAFDHYFDPHTKSGDDDGGSKTPPSDPPLDPGPSHSAPLEPTSIDSPEKTDAPRELVGK